MFDSKTIPRVFKVPVGVDFSRVFLDGLKSRLHEKEPHELARVIVLLIQEEQSENSKNYL